MFFLLLIFITPLLFLFAFGIGMEAKKIALSWMLSIVSSATWIVFSLEVRSFLAGDRIIDPFRSADGRIVTIGALRVDASRRWYVVALSLASMSIEAGYLFSGGNLRWMLNFRNGSFFTQFL
jgi:hypothetical protein